MFQAFSHISKEFPYIYALQIRMGFLSNCKPITKKGVSTYSFGFNGKEKDPEIKGQGNSLDFGVRIYDPRVGTWLSRDPKESEYPSWSTYCSFMNNPTYIVDPTGEGGIVYYDKKANEFVVKATFYIYSDDPSVSNATLSQIETTILNQVSTFMNANKGISGIPKHPKEAVNVRFDIEVKALLTENNGGPTSMEKAMNQACEDSEKSEVNFLYINNSFNKNEMHGRVGFFTDNIFNSGISVFAHEFWHSLGFYSDINDPIRGRTHTKWNYKIATQGIMAFTLPPYEFLNFADLPKQILQSDFMGLDMGKAWSTFSRTSSVGAYFGAQYSIKSLQLPYSGNLTESFNYFSKITTDYEDFQLTH